MEADELIQLVADLKKLIANAKTDHAIEILLDFSSKYENKYSFLENEVVLLASRYNEYKKAEIRGILEGSQELNKINSSIIELLNNLKNKEVLNKENTEQVSSAFRRIILADNSTIEEALYDAEKIYEKNEGSYKVAKLKLHITEIKNTLSKNLIIVPVRLVGPPINISALSFNLHGLFISPELNLHNEKRLSVNYFALQFEANMPINYQKKLGIYYCSTLEDYHSMIKLNLQKYFNPLPQHQHPQYNFARLPNRQSRNSFP